MSATYAAARAALDRAQHAAAEALADDYPATLAQIGTGRAALEVAEQLEALVELLRPLVEQGGTGHPVDEPCSCEHPAARHYRSHCEARDCACGGYYPPVKDGTGG